LENKKERLEAKAERQAEALQHKREKVEEFKKTQKATEQSLADARTKEADEKIKEKAAMVSEMLTLGNYGDAVNDLLNLDDKD
jgi:Skp family chaperone for outer membrane proteins